MKSSLNKAVKSVHSQSILSVRVTCSLSVGSMASKEVKYFGQVRLESVVSPVRQVNPGIEAFQSQI